MTFVSSNVGSKQLSSTIMWDQHLFLYSVAKMHWEFQGWKLMIKMDQRYNLTVSHQPIAETTTTFPKIYLSKQKRQCMAGHTHGLRFCQNIKGQLPVLSVGMDQRTDRHRITELADRGDATRKVTGCGPCGTFTCRA